MSAAEQPEPPTPGTPSPGTSPDAADGDPPTAPIDQSGATPAETPQPASGRRRAGGRRRRPRGKAPWWELPLLVIVAVVIAVLIKTFVVQPFYIPSQSMELTLHGCPGCSGDRVLVNKLIYDFRDPHPGDIVVFSAARGLGRRADARRRRRTRSCGWCAVSAS